MQTRVLINNQLSGILTTPKITKNKIPAILFLHGFGTSKDEVGDTFKIAAEKLSQQGIGSLRIDFSGFGESKGVSSDTTIDNLIKDAEQSLDFLLAQDSIDPLRVGICGFSLGAGISVLVTQHRFRTIKSMTLLSPAGDLPKDFNEYFGNDQYKQLENSEKEMELDLGWRRVKLKNNFIKSLKQHSPLTAIQSFKGSFFVIAGENDFSCKHAHSYIKKSNNAKEKKAIIINNSDHIFNAICSETSSIDIVTDEVSFWFKNTL